MRPAPDPPLFNAPSVHSLYALGPGVRFSLAFEYSIMSSILGVLPTSGVAFISVEVSAR
ncbi:hypothetical protein Tco_0433637, partial [Tanacetum coccineum]